VITPVRQPEPTTTVGQLADLLRISPWTVRSLIRRNQIKATRIGRQLRIPAHEVARLTGCEQW
jgi:excisionase family DNA binding protein